MRNYAVLGFEKVAAEQGRWAAETALRILEGASPSDIEIAHNVEGYLVVNGRIAEAGGFEIPGELVEGRRPHSGVMRLPRSTSMCCGAGLSGP